MIELIDRKQLHDRLDGLKFHLEVGMEGMLNDAALSACQYVFGCVNEFINDLSEKSVKVVKCKDCKRRKNCTHTRRLGINGFCSEGE